MASSATLSNPPVNIIIVERLGALKGLIVKDFNPEELFKKCGFKKADGFCQQFAWNIKHRGSKYSIELFAKKTGRANSENKYDFPPPVDNKLFYGCCALVAHYKYPDGRKIYTNLPVSMWEEMYNTLFGGFENLDDTAEEDENEEDELELIPKEHKTKQGYLKDGFVVDSEDSSIDEIHDSSMDTASIEEETEEEEQVIGDDDGDDDDDDDDDIGSELSEEMYEYDDDAADDVKK